MSEILNEHALARLEKPLRLTSRLYQSGENLKRDTKINFRFKEILSLHLKWAHTCRRVLALNKRFDRKLSWLNYSQMELGPNDNRQSLTHSSTHMHYLESLNNGFALDVKSVHAARHLWYFEPKVKYNKDCTLLLVKLLNNMRWCRDNGQYHLMNPEPGFPLMNYEMGYGPTFPSRGEVFGKRDEQIVISDDDGKLIYFELGHTGLLEGKLLSINMQ